MLHVHSAQGTCVFRYLLGNMNWQHFENLNTTSEFIVVLKIYVFVQRCQTQSEKKVNSKYKLFQSLIPFTFSKKWCISYKTDGCL